MVFFSGMPSDAAGPVADTVTPTVMSACAAKAAARRTAAVRKALGFRVIESSPVWDGKKSGGCAGGPRARAGVGNRRGGVRRAHRMQAAEEEVGDDRRHLGMAE